MASSDKRSRSTAPSGRHRASDSDNGARSRSRAKYRRAARFYDRIYHDLGTILGYQALRLRAIDNLELRPGNQVLDVGCGTGLSFEPLMERIGAKGHLVGVEQSPEMLAIARARVQAAGWENVTLIESPMERAATVAPVDGVLFCLVHDLTRNPRAVARALGLLAPGGRVSVFGGKLPPRGAALPLHYLGRALMSPWVTSFEGGHEPWTLIQEHVPLLDVTTNPFRSTYLAHGRLFEPGERWLAGKPGATVV